MSGAGGGGIMIAKVTKHGTKTQKNSDVCNSFCAFFKQNIRGILAYMFINIYIA